MEVGRVKEKFLHPYQHDAYEERLTDHLPISARRYSLTKSQHNTRRMVHALLLLAPGPPPPRPRYFIWHYNRALIVSRGGERGRGGSIMAPIKLLALRTEGEGGADVGRTERKGGV